MKKASEDMTEKIINTSFKKPLFKIINNVDAKVEMDPNKIKKKLIDQIFSTVKWRESVIFMEKSGVKNFIEIGPGKLYAVWLKEPLKMLIAFQLIQLLILKTY